MIDIHTHILPGVDDGVKDDQEAVEFARMASEDGVRTIVATPHCKEGFFFLQRQEVLDAVERLRGLLVSASVDVEIVPGGEVHISPDLVERIRDGRAPTLGDNGRTLLLELSLSQYPVELENLVFQLKLAGILPIFAHPERVRYFQDDIRRYESVIRFGGYGQITTGSITGGFGEDVQEFSTELLRKRLVHVVASDAHNIRRRPPVLSRAIDVAPLDPIFRSFYGYYLYCGRRFDEALRQWKGLPEPNVSTLFLLAQAYFVQGMEEESYEFFRDWLRGSFSRAADAFDRECQESGIRAALRSLRDELSLRAKTNYVSFTLLASLSVWAEDLAGAVGFLERACEAHEAMVPQLAVGPHWDPLRSDPRFQDLLRRIGIPTG